MTPKQILDSFSETLMRDERILSSRERELLQTLLQHAKAASTENHHMQEAVRSVIATAVGETVAQRAFAVLGGSIVDRILEGSTLSSDAANRTAEVLGPKDPEPPGVKAPPKQPVRDPEPPGVKVPPRPIRDIPRPPAPPDPEPPGVKKPGKPMRDTPMPDPEPPGHGATTKVISGSSLGVAERPEFLGAHCVVLDEFLAPQELDALTRFTLEHESDFSASEVVSPTHEKGVVNYDHRRSRVLMDLGSHENVILARIKTVLPQVLEKLGMQEFAIADVEAQITASNDGDYFHFHCDNGSGKVSSRHLTFVYFFHREPRQFEGGELRIHDAHLDGGTYISEGNYQTIVPQQNQIVFFPCELLHEITAVKCSSQLFADSRFTLNGWLRR
jgi:Rps23 Pro-64 3,4-dihydroxylase Tpa1-like proline 4-hydroxylase